MFTDRYDIAISTASPEARDAYVEGTDLLLALYPGAVEAFERATAADPGFALAHAGRAQVLLREGKVAAARASLAAAKSLNANLTDREASHLAFLDLLFAGEAEAATAALRAHLTAWPRDALALMTTVTPNGLIGASGRIGQKHEIAALLDNLADHYGDDWWFTAHHGMALAEDGRQAAGRPKVERSMAQNPRNANAAHALAHVCYEEGETNAAREFLAAWLADYPRDGFFHGHLNWHLALVELAAGNTDEAFRRYRDACCLERHSGPPQQRMTDATAFLWRAELAGLPRDAAAWRDVYEFSNDALPKPSNGLADLHVILARAVAGDDGGLEQRATQIEDLARAGRYPSGPYLPALARAFAAFEKQDFPAAIAALEPFAGQSERIGGSRAQLDLVEFTLLKAYLAAGRADAADSLLSTRRAGPSPIPVAGLAPH